MFLYEKIGGLLQSRIGYGTFDVGVNALARMQLVHMSFLHIDMTKILKSVCIDSCIQDSMLSPFSFFPFYGQKMWKVWWTSGFC